jgi:hypothetical protein
MRRFALLVLMLCGAVEAAAQPGGQGTAAAGAPASAGAAPSSAAAPTSAAPPAVSAAPAPASQAAAPAPSSAGEPPAGSGSAQVTVERSEPAAAQAAPENGDEAYQLKVRELETRVNDLKEKIFRSKTRLAILKEAVLATSIAGAEAQIIHRNEMGSTFHLEKVVYSLDGAPIFSRVDVDGDLDKQEELEIFNGPIVPGNHTVSVVMSYRGSGFGIFSYLSGYQFTVRDSYTFRGEEGKKLRVKVVGYEKGGITTDLKDRPSIRFEPQIFDSRRGSPQAAAETPTGADK